MQVVNASNNEDSSDEHLPSTSQSAEGPLVHDNIQLDRPNHPPPNVYPIQQCGTKERQLKFQLSWYKAYPWLHSEGGISGVLCFYCMKSHMACGIQSVAKNADAAFTVTGFTNWRKAIEKFKIHQSSHAHVAAVTQFLHAKSPVTAQLSTQHHQQQQTSRNCLLSVVKCMAFLARQGIAFRGHEQGESNFDQLVAFSASTNADLKMWLERNQDYTSPTIQNEILGLMAKDVVRSVCRNVCKQQPAIFSIVVDGTRDITGIEQESICVRYVNEHLDTVEDFLGFYAVDDTKGKSIAAIIMDALLRLQLPLNLLRGQTYDGASNMSGTYNGAQAEVRKAQPLAHYVHCIGHCVNLATEAAMSESPLIRDAVSLVNELGVMSSQSGKFQSLFLKTASSNYDKVTKLRPLCPTRWTVRTKAIQYVINQYEAILSALEAMSMMKTDVATRAAGLLTKFQHGNTYMALVLAADVIGQLETLNSSLQSRKMTMSGMRAAIDAVIKSLEVKRTPEHFQELKAQAIMKQSEFDLDEMQVPRARKPPARLTGPSSAHHPTSIDQYFSVEYYKLIDTASVKLNDTVKQEGAISYGTLESCLLSGTINDTCQNYPEFDYDLLRMQLEMFRRQFQYTTVDEAADVMRQQVPEVRLLFSQVETLIRLLMVIPVTSCEAERSFSSLRRLKTWLRSTMTHARLNHVAVCNIHKKYIDSLDLMAIVNEFVELNERRLRFFGKF